MIPLVAPTELDRHSKRLLVDAAEWRDRLEQLAELRRRRPVSAIDSKAERASASSATSLKAARAVERR